MRTKLAISREIAKKCRNKKISVTYFGGLLCVCGVPLTVNDGYVKAYMRSCNGQLFTYVVRYDSFGEWFFKFQRMRSFLPTVVPKQVLKRRLYERSSALRTS